jgi:CheY-like chemotaxis protein
MKRILLVEDNITLLENIAFELQIRDYDVVQAESGKSALDMLGLATHLPDVIISDIAMPDLNGYDLLEKLRKDPTLADIPVIFLTAFDSPNAVMLAEELGVDDYLVKPIKPEDLIAAIEKKIKA